MRFSIGDKVTLSDKAVRELVYIRQGKERIGIVVGFSRDRMCCRVQWSGTKSGQTMHEDFLDKAGVA